MSKSNGWGWTDDSTGSMDVARTQCNWDETKPSTAVCELIAEATGRDQLDFAPLYDSIDPEALDRVIESGTGSNTVSISFEHDGHSVTIRSDGEVVVHTLNANDGV